jgi:hypothetical protein
MYDRTLVPVVEARLALGGLAVLLASFILRQLVPLVVVRSFAMNQGELVAAASLGGVLLLTGALWPRSPGVIAPRNYAALVLYPAGVLAWLLALIMVLESVGMLAGIHDLAYLWYLLNIGSARQGFAAVATALSLSGAGIIAWLVMQVRARRAIGRHGHEWIRNWGLRQPLLTRYYLMRLLFSLGYRPDVR